MNRARSQSKEADKEINIEKKTQLKKDCINVCGQLPQENIIDDDVMCLVYNIWTWELSFIV